MFKQLKKDERGVFGYGYAFLVTVILCIVIFGVLAILTSNFASVTMNALQSIQTLTLQNASQITDANISASMVASVQSTQSLQQTNVEMFQIIGSFVGILTILILAVVFFLLTQRNVQANAGGLQ